MVADARITPAINADQKLSPKRSAKANGIKNGRPSGTRINVSLASADIAGKSPCFVHAIMKAKTLTSGNVKSNPPMRGYLGPISVTAIMIAPAMIPLNSVI